MKHQWPAHLIIWSQWIRLLHWLVVIPLFFIILIIETGDEWHIRLGYITLAFVLIRIFWGFISKDHSNFKEFSLSPHQVISFVQDYFSKSAKVYPGHNPMASLVYVFIWLTILILSATGYMMGTDYFFATEWVMDTHEYSALFLNFLIISHFIGMTADSLKFRRHSWLAMFTGRK